MELDKDCTEFKVYYLESGGSDPPALTTIIYIRVPVNKRTKIAYRCPVIISPTCGDLGSECWSSDSRKQAVAALAGYAYSQVFRFLPEGCAMDIQRDYRTERN